MTTSPHVIVIGGGISGLAACRKLQQCSALPLSVELLEASDRLGGVLQTIERDGFLLEGGPDCFLSEKPRGIGLCRELGMAGELIGTSTENRRSFIVRNGSLHAVPEGFYLLGPAKIWPFLRSRVLSLKGKARLLCEPLITQNPKTDESLASFVRRRLGQEALDWLAQPLVGGIYAADPEQLSLRATFPQFLEMEKMGGVIRSLRRTRKAPGRSQASGPRYSLFVAPKHGVGTLVQKLEESLTTTLIKRNSPVSSLSRSADGRRWRITLTDGQLKEADALCLALASSQTAQLLTDFDSELATTLKAVPHVPSITAHFAFKRSDITHPLNGFGMVIPTAEKRLISACTFVHQKFAGRAPQGFALLRVFMGGAASASEGIGSRDDSEMMQLCLKDLKELLGIHGPPVLTHLTRHAVGLAQYTLGHLDRMRTIQTLMNQHPALSLCGNWKDGVGIPDCIQSGEQAADRLIYHLQASMQAAQN